MKTFKVLKHPTGEVQVVKQGWNWPAFFFGFIWALVAKFWVMGTVLFFVLALGAIGVGLSGADPVVELSFHLVSVIVNVTLAIKGNAWREKQLLSRGFELQDTINAGNKDAALALYIKKGTPAAA